jgi:hypothetical protein
MPLVDAGRDVAGEVRNSATHDGAGRRDTSAAAPAARPRRTAATSA